MMRFELYAARRGVLLRKQWRWRLRAGNNRIIAVSGEGYNNRSDAAHAIGLVRGDREIPVEVLP